MESHWEQVFASTTWQCEASSVADPQRAQGTGNNPAANTFWVNNNRKGELCAGCAHRRAREQCFVTASLNFHGSTAGCCWEGSERATTSYTSWGTGIVPSMQRRRARPEALNISLECIYWGQASSAGNDKCVPAHPQQENDILEANEGGTKEAGWGIITTKDHSKQNSAIGLHISSMPSISLIQQKQHYQPLLSSPA